MSRYLMGHPDVSGFRNTGVPEDEGQHLQTVVPPAKRFGGPGQFAFDAGSYLDETSALATSANAAAIWAAWRPWWNLDRPVLLEKSPTSIVRTRFFQALFPGSKFVVIVRHPVIVAKASMRWSKLGLTQLVLHWCLAHERLLADLPYLGGQALVIRYEDAVARPAAFKTQILAFLNLRQDVGLDSLVDHNIEYPLMADDLATLPLRTLGPRFADLLARFDYRLDG